MGRSKWSNKYKNLKTYIPSKAQMDDSKHLKRLRRKILEVAK